MIRYEPNIQQGLSTKQVEDRKKEHLVNISSIPTTKSTKQIFLMHILTLFNILNICLGICIILVGSYRNLLFLGVVICNTVIGIYQEIKAKKIVDKLSLISEKKATVVRNGIKETINYEEVVLDDIVQYKLGNQIIADAVILSGNCEVNESMVTGESNSIIKKKGDYVLSGSFVVSGEIITKTEKVGRETYTSIISDGAKYIKVVESEIIHTINKVIKLLSIIIIPLGILLFWKQMSLEGNSLQVSVINTVAALIGMIPEGLVLLTSTVFAVSVIRLSKYNVLVKELYSIEVLARVDTLCLDKTGTITEGSMELYDIIPFESFNKSDVEKILINLSSNLIDENPTMMAIKKEYMNGQYDVADEIYNFSSEKKYSGIKINNSIYILGAFDFLLNEKQLKLAQKYALENRVLALVKFDNVIHNLNENTPIGLILLRDKIRNNATKTIQYFKNQGVEVKIISGDNPETVSSISKRVGITGYDKYIDASTLITDKDIESATKKYNIFGRVKPNQKEKIIHYLRKKHTVAYVGDGVNDVLALKEADCSITFQKASEAARNVSNLVLLDSDFNSLPLIVAEGRRTINNIERSSTLFLVKTIYSSLLAIIFLFLNVAYPFIPIQLTLVSVLTIGIPSFILALEPNKERVTGHFFTNVISKSLPAAITIVSNIMIVVIVKALFKFDVHETSTLCVMLTGFTGFILLYRLCKPFNIIRSILLSCLISIFCLCILGMRNIFVLSSLTPYMLVLILILTILSYIIFNLMMNLVEKYIIPRIR